MDRIQEVLDKFFDAWNRAFISKDEGEIKGFMSDNFVGYWAHSNLDKPDQYDYHYDLNSVLQQYEDAKKSFVTESI